jgi:nicotinamide-nucleotide amidase
MNLGILTIGNELLSGRTADSNSSFIAKELAPLGWRVTKIMSVGDEENAIKGALDHLFLSSQGVIATGGLGPTADDLTTACIAQAFGRKLILHEPALRDIQDRFARLNLPWTENNTKQAFFPEGATPLPNPAGTAWGFYLPVKDQFVIVIPGVPREVQRILPEKVLPLLKSLFPGEAPAAETVTIKLFGLPEARVDAALGDVDFAGMDVQVGFYPNFPENHLVLTAHQEEAAARKNSLVLAQAEVEKRLGSHIFAYNEDTLEGLVGRYLTEKQLKLALAESCTGGLIAHRLTNQPGSSLYFDRSLVVYSNQAKTQLLGIPEEVIGAYGAVSRETVILMAEGVLKESGADLGLAVTGIAGPAGGTESKPVGTVFVALADGNQTISRQFRFPWDRLRNKTLFSQVALLMLLKYLRGENTP